MSWSNLESTVQQFAAHGTVGYTQRKPHRATLSGELMAVRRYKKGYWVVPLPKGQRKKANSENCI
jgi:hypothetical protein